MFCATRKSVLHNGWKDFEDAFKDFFKIREDDEGKGEERERAGAEDIGADAERKGLGTPATRADIIEKLVKDGCIRREKRRIVPTEDGIRLTAMLPDVVKGKCGAYCKNRCSMNVSRVMGTALTDGQVKSMLEGKKTLVKGLKGKRGSYDAYLTPEDVEDYSYTKDGKEIKGTQYKVKLEFPQKKNNGKSIRI